MDWLAPNNRPAKGVEFYQRKALSFLFSSEGRDELRCLNIPYSHLGFYNPMHFLSLIPDELCEPFRNDKLFLVSSGTVRKGDKVLLLERGAEGVIRSAVFKERRVRRKSGDTEILLDGHRRTYSEDEIVPYKEYLRQQLGTSLAPENRYVISVDGALEWEEPTWEPGQEVYYKPEKRWATVLSHEANAKGKTFVIIKLDETPQRKEKTARIALNELVQNSVPARIPKRVQGETVVGRESMSSSEGHGNDNMEVFRVGSPPGGARRDEMDASRANGNGHNVSFDKGSDGNSTMSDIMTTETIYAEVMPKNQRKSPKRDKGSSPFSFSFVNSFLSKKPSNKTNGRQRPVSEYYPPSPESPKHETPAVIPDAEIKSKSCNNLTAVMSDDDDLDPFETANYTNSLRSSARKIIQKQLARDSTRSSSLKGPSNPTLSRPHVAEIFTVPQSQSNGMSEDIPTRPMRSKSPKKQLEESTRLPTTRHNDVVDYVMRPPSYYLATSQVNARATPSPTVMTRDSPMLTSSSYLSRLSPLPIVTSSSYASRLSPLPTVTSPYSRASPIPNVTYSLYTTRTSPLPSTNHADPDAPPLPSTLSPSKTETQSTRYNHYNPPPLPSLDFMRQKPNQSPLEYNYLPLSSSELVKQQQFVVNRVLNGPQKEMASEYVVLKPPTKYTETIAISSDSSSNEIDSGRGSSQYTPDILKSKQTGSCEMLYESSPKTRRHPAFEKIQSIINANENPENKSGTINNNLQRRYTKNNKLSKHNMAKYSMNGEENGEGEEKMSIPQPFNPANLLPVAGHGKGIQAGMNSSYADATLFALFTCSNIFDKNLLFSKPGLVERGLKRDVRTILSTKIVTPLRSTGFCKKENVTHLREAMLPLSSKMHSPLMDAEEFMYLLFDSALNIESFIEFSNGSKDYIHQIIARPKDRSKSQTVQFMLETSLGTSGNKFKKNPSPALFLCMPRCKGRLVYYEAIIPSLQLNITRVLQKGPKQCVCEMAATLECAICHKKNGEVALDFCSVCRGIADQIHFRLDHAPVLVSKSQKDEILNLHSIICTRGNHYVAFVKASEQRLSPWLFFDSNGEFPEVTLLEDFGKWLDSLEKQPGSFREFAKLHPLLKRIMTDGHIYIYSKTHLTDANTFTESFAI